MTLPAVGDLVEVVADRPVAGGRMLARFEGAVVLVSGAIPGERVRVRIEKVGRGISFGGVDEVLEPAASRRSVRYDPLCGGLAYAHIAYDAQPALKRAVIVDALRHGGRVDWREELPVHPSPEAGYRLRARLHVRGGSVGFFREGTHALCDAAPSGQLHAAAMPAVHRLIDGLPRSLRVALEAIELTENLPGTERAVHLGLMRGARVPASDFAAVPLVEGLTGISSAEHDAARPIALAGTPSVSDPLQSIVGDDVRVPPGAEMRRHAPAFFQANRFLLRDLVGAVTRAVAPGPVVDLYAGVGLFSAVLAARGHAPVTAVEGDPVSGADLVANARPFGDAIVVERTSVEAFLQRARVAPEATLLVDPPRTGLSREALDALLGVRAGRLVYVSCDVATLARDLKRAIDAGYALRSLEAFDLFPNTAHVETVAVLDRQ